MKKFYNAFAVVATMLVIGCAQLGIATPQTFNQRLAVGYGAVTQVRETATTLLATSKISSADAQNVQTAADVARTGLDTARTMHATDPSGADNKLNAIRTGLQALIGYLATRQ